MIQARNIKIKSLTEYLGIKEQSLHNKFTRDSFTADELVAIADFAGVKLAFLLNDDEKILIKKDLQPMILLPTQLTFYAPKDKITQNPVAGQRVKVACRSGHYTGPDDYSFNTPSGLVFRDALVYAIEDEQCILTIEITMPESECASVPGDMVDISSMRNEPWSKGSANELPLKYIWAAE